VKGSVMGHLAAVEAALPAEEKSLLGALRQQQQQQ
jgi:hypothetical protein